MKILPCLKLGLRAVKTFVSELLFSATDCSQWTSCHQDQWRGYFPIASVIDSVYGPLRVLLAGRNWKQECIPVGCVPPAAVAICWGEGCLRQCMLGYNPMGLGLGLDPTPLGLGLDTSPWCGPGHPPRCWPGDPPPPDQTPKLLPWDWA